MYLSPCAQKEAKSHVSFTTVYLQKMRIHSETCKNDYEDIEMLYLTKDYMRNVTFHKVSKATV